MQAYLAWKKLKAYQLAKAAGIPGPSLYRYLKGERDLALKTVEKIRETMEA